MNVGNGNIEKDISIGKEIFEKIPNEVRPGWAALILTQFDYLIKNVPVSVTNLYPIVYNQTRWHEAHQQFTEIRRFLLNNKFFRPEQYILLAELVAKVTYNASGFPAPFDHDSGWHIPGIALTLASSFNNESLKHEVKNIILMFNRHEKLRVDLDAAKDAILYRKIDQILWLDWNPIGVSDFTLRDEYQSYLPIIFNLKKTEADFETIAKKLYDIEVNAMGLNGRIEICTKVAKKIIALSQ